MKIGDKVKYIERKNYEEPYYGYTGFVMNISKDNTAALINFGYADIWCMCSSLEVIE